MNVCTMGVGEYGEFCGRSPVIAEAHHTDPVTGKRQELALCRRHFTDAWRHNAVLAGWTWLEHPALGLIGGDAA